MSEPTINSLSALEKLTLAEEIENLIGKINSNEISELDKIESKEGLNILLALVLSDESIPNSREKIKLAKELSKITNALKQNNINQVEKNKLLSRREKIVYLLLSNNEKKKATIFSVLNRYNQSLKRDLKEKLETIDPYALERIIAELLSRMGYANVEATKKSRDGGIDIFAYSDVSKLHRIKTVIQVKRTKAKVSAPVVDNLRGAMDACGADRGLIITTSDFSKDCRKLTEHDSALKVHLINGNELVDLLIQHEVGVKSENITIYSIDEDFLSSV